MRPVAALLLVVLTGAAANPFQEVSEILSAAAANHTFPGCTAIVGNASGLMYSGAFGHLNYNAYSSSVSLETRYDLASLTKVLATTTSVMMLYQAGYLDLDELVSSPSLLGIAFSNNGKETITLRNLLMHNAGFPPDPVPAYSDPSFGCPETKSFHPQEQFSCTQQVYDSLVKQTLANPVGAVYVYSDLSMITMAHVIGLVVQQNALVGTSDLLPACASASVPYTCYYEAFVRKHVVERLGLSGGFLPARSLWAGIAPTWYDSSYRHEQVQGQVSDANAYAMGGVSGHAGFFLHVKDVATLVSSIAFASPDDPYVNKTTVDYFTTAKNLTQSSRALGWDTNDYKMNTYRGCSTLSPLTYTHTGYTGTEVCVDPTREIFTVLLTNRCYPVQTDFTNIHATRQKFNAAVASLIPQSSAAH